MQTICIWGKGCRKYPEIISLLSYVLQSFLLARLWAHFSLQFIFRQWEQFYSEQLYFHHTHGAYTFSVCVLICYITSNVESIHWMYYIMLHYVEHICWMYILIFTFSIYIGDINSYFMFSGYIYTGCINYVHWMYIVNIHLDINVKHTCWPYIFNVDIQYVQCICIHGMYTEGTR